MQDCRAQAAAVSKNYVGWDADAGKRLAGGCVAIQNAGGIIEPCLTMN